jgi:hypothetical protein
VWSFSGGRPAGSVLGTLDEHGDQRVADIVLDETAVNGLTLSDVNGRQYMLWPGGQVGSLSTGTFEAFQQSETLLLGSTTNPATFVGDFAGPASLDGRQLTIRNTTRADGGFPARIAGLTVSRKWFVPGSGDFVRYLDVLENTTAAPITLELVRVQTQFAAFSPRFVATSSGDATLDATDRWLVADDQFAAARPSAAIVFQGAGAARPADVASIGQFFQDPRRPFVEWRNLTIPAGGRVILMHFAVQQRDPASATAAAERLVLAGPEAIGDLSNEDREDVVNFALPLTSARTTPLLRPGPPLPPLTYWIPE